jgi:hypothetical protein
MKYDKAITAKNKNLIKVMKIVGWSLTQVSSLRLKPFGEFDSN